LDVLFNNAGIAANQEKVDREILRKIFETNVFGTMLLSNALMPLLKKSKQPRIINVSSVMGSIGMKLDTSVPFHQVGVEVYRMSKAALNMLSAHQYTVMKEFGGIAFSYCPGRVATNLDGGADMSEEERKEAGMDTPEFSAKNLVEVVDGKRDGEVGKFIASRNVQHPW
jgi:NAD(P)-dependent dehydrogenase (short-subunit alcohol dehydrogenase family)